MNNEEKKKNKVAQLLDESENIAVMSSKVAGLDAFCAGAALYHVLKAKDKPVTFIYPGKVPEGGDDLVSEGDVTKDVTERDLIVSIDYSGSGASKVNYATDNGILNIKIGPVSPTYSEEGKIRSQIRGFSFDTIFTIGAQNLYDLGKAYQNLDKSTKVAKIVNLDITDRNDRFGLIDIVDPMVNSLSLLLFQHLTSWELTPNEKSAEAILRGIKSKELPYKEG